MQTQLLKNVLGAFLLLLFFAFTTSVFAGTSAGLSSAGPSSASAAQYHHYRHHHYRHHHYYHHHPAVHVVIHN